MPSTRPAAMLSPCLFPETLSQAWNNKLGHARAVIN